MPSVGPLMSQIPSVLGGGAPAAAAADDEAGEEGRVTIFHTFLNDQILVTELGDVIALQAYLTLYNVSFLLDERINAEDMSPDGVLPFIRCGSKLVSGYENIIEYINTAKKIEYQDSISSKKAARITLFRKVFYKAEQYYTWLNKDIYNNFTRQRYSYGRPWPLTMFICWSQKWDVSWKIEDTSNIELEFENLLDEFSGLLDEHKPFIFGNQPCDLDTLIYGHLKAIIANKEVFHQLYSIVVKFPNLVNYIAIIDDMVSQH